MENSAYRSVCLALGLALIALVIYSIRETCYYNSQSRNIASADYKTTYFADLTEKALKDNTMHAARCLEAVVHEYQLGGDDKAGLLLHEMVERARSQSIRDIIAYLRSTTDTDLGNDPDPWIKEYAHEMYDPTKLP